MACDFPGSRTGAGTFGCLHSAQCLVCLVCFGVLGVLGVYGVPGVLDTLSLFFHFSLKLLKDFFKFVLKLGWDAAGMINI